MFPHRSHLTRPTSPLPLPLCHPFVALHLEAPLLTSSPQPSAVLLFIPSHIPLNLQCSPRLHNSCFHTHARRHTYKKKKTHTAVVSLQGATSILCEHEYLIGLPPQSSQFIMLYWAVSAQLHAAPHRACAAISFTAAVVAQWRWRQIISSHLRCCFCFFMSCIQR